MGVGGEGDGERSISTNPSAGSERWLYVVLTIRENAEFMDS